MGCSGGRHTVHRHRRLGRSPVEEIVVDINEAGDAIEAVIHWKGGIHSALRVRKNTTGYRRVGADKTTEILTQMAGRFSDEDIALTLDRVGIRTARGLTWNAGRVRAYRSYHKLPALDRTGEDLHGSAAASTGQRVDLVGDRFILHLLQRVRSKSDYLPVEVYGSAVASV